jgi:hypothetical protein
MQITFSEIGILALDWNNSMACDFWIEERVYSAREDIYEYPVDHPVSMINFNLDFQILA